MKEENEKSLKKGNKPYFYAILACAAVLLAAAIVITAVTLSGGKDYTAQLPVEPNPPTPVQPITPDEPNKPDTPIEPDVPDAPVDADDGFYAPLSETVALNQHGFYYNKTLNCYHLHEGIDFAAEAGSTVYAAEDGVVQEVFASDLICGGKIVVKHANDVYTVYEYVDVAADLKEGDSVTRGQAIGTVASAVGAEYKEGAHLHFEVLKNGESVDPTAYLTMEEK